MAHVYTLSAALGECIYSYFLPQVETEMSGAFTRQYTGAECHTNSHQD